MTKEIKLATLKFYKISGEKNTDFSGKISMKPQLGIEKIEKLKEGKSEAASVYFKFGINYGDLGNLELHGRMILVMDPKTLKDTLKGWEEKKLDQETNLIILNAVMHKASLKALQIEEELGLPPHISLPRLKLGSKK